MSEHDWQLHGYPAPRHPAGKLHAVDAMIDAYDLVKSSGVRLVTDDAIRSLVISQHLLGTQEVIVLEHTRAPAVMPQPRDPLEVIACQAHGGTYITALDMCEIEGTK